MTNGVAAFDFDGTITQRDTLVPFLARQGRRRFVSGSTLGALRSTRDARSEFRNEMKAAVLQTMFAGRRAAEIDSAGAAYATELPARYRNESLDRIAWHKSQGHQLVLVTASLGVYARPAGAALGFHHVIAVELEIGADGLLTGNLQGPNVRCAEKATRLEAHIDEHFAGAQPELWAYGDSTGDVEMLDMAKHPTWVGRRAQRQSE